MTATQLACRLATRQKVDDHVVAPKGLGEAATKIYNEFWHRPGTIVGTRYYAIDESLAVYVVRI